MLTVNTRNCLAKKIVISYISIKEIQVNSEKHLTIKCLISFKEFK